MGRSSSCSRGTKRECSEEWRGEVFCLGLLGKGRLLIKNQIACRKVRMSFLPRTAESKKGLPHSENVRSLTWRQPMLPGRRGMSALSKGGNLG